MRWVRKFVKLLFDKDVRLLSGGGPDEIKKAQQQLKTDQDVGQARS